MMRCQIIFCGVIAIVISAAVHAAGTSSREEKIQETLKRVAAYAQCRDLLAVSPYPGQREELAAKIRGMRAAFMRDGIDYESFLGIRGECEDIFGDWFFDGAWVVNSVYFNFVNVVNPVRLARMLAGRPKAAGDLTAAGGIPDSAFFFNRDIASVTPEALRAEDEEIRPKGKLKITRKKGEGQSKGFFGVDEAGRDYICIVDPPGMEEQVTGAEVVGSTLIRIAGYNIPCSAIVTIEGTGNPEFDGKRGVATRTLNEYKGHWTYRAFRGRRELRATKVLGAWIHNTDWIDHNTGIIVAGVDGVPLTRYYVFDFGGSLGSWNIRIKEPRDGWEHYVDFSVMMSWPVTFPLLKAGLMRRPYPAEGPSYSPAVGYFDANVSAAGYQP
ncbi:MAG: hypothetical protein NT045_03215, partial [Candidatus Aureabacteria bacterium]|nr:hypothetical protein [Candidatus Auribacterota bacterium]